MPKLPKAQQQQQEQSDAINRLREFIHPGDTLYTILRHRSRSGMVRHISVVQIRPEGPHDLTWLTARALGRRMADDGGLVEHGAGMDMGFHLVYSLSSALYGRTGDSSGVGYRCLGSDCPSSTHASYRGPYPEPRSSDTVHHDGYAISQRWL